MTGVEGKGKMKELCYNKLKKKERDRERKKDQGSSRWQ
jgi:hypothetical protein